MLLILQILLTVLTWKKGWKWFSLIPISASFIIGIVYGLTSSIQGIEAPRYYFLILDSISTIVLGIMYFYPPKKTT